VCVSVSVCLSVSSFSFFFHFMTQQNIYRFCAMGYDCKVNIDQNALYYESAVMECDHEDYTIMFQEHCYDGETSIIVYATSTSTSKSTQVSSYTSSSMLAGAISIGCQKPTVDETVSLTQTPSSSSSITIQGTNFQSFSGTRAYQFDFSCEIEGTITNITTVSEITPSLSSITEILVPNVSLTSCLSRSLSDSPYVYLSAMRVQCDDSCRSCIQACPNSTLDTPCYPSNYCNVSLSSSEIKIATFLTVKDTSTSQSFADGSNQITVYVDSLLTIYIHTHLYVYHHTLHTNVTRLGTDMASRRQRITTLTTSSCCQHRNVLKTLF